MNFEHTSIKQSFWRFVLPSVSAQWIFALYTMVDGMFVARGVGETALSAVNIAMPFVTMMFAVSILFAVGTSTMAAIYLGQKKTEEANMLFTQNFIVLLAFCAFLIAAVYLKIDDLAVFLGATRTTFPYVKEYILSILPFAWCFILSYSFEVLVKTDGYPRLASIAVTVGALANCVLDYIFVFLFHWGIGGAGFATALSQLIVIILYLTHFLSRRCTLRFVKCKIDPVKQIRVFQIGLSSGLTEISAGVIVFLFNHMILKYIGEMGIISYTMIAYVNTIVTMSMFGIAQGVQPLLSFFYGKKDFPSCRKLIGYTWRLTLAASVFSFAAVCLGAHWIVRLFINTGSTELVLFSVKAMRIFSVSFLFAGINIIGGGFFTAVECPRESLILSAARGFLVIAASLEICALLPGGNGIWWAAALSELVCLGLNLWLFRSYGQKRPKLMRN